MNEVITAAGAFPTAIYTGLLIASLFYWTMVILGAFDLGLGHGHGDGAGHVDAGHAGGHGDVHAEAHAGHGDGHAHGEADGHGLLEFLSVGRVPLSITVSAVVFVAWIASMLSEMLLRAPFSAMVPSFLFNVAEGGAALVTGMIVGGFMVRPLRPVFVADGEHGESHLEGRMVRITSGKVDQRYGTASLPTNGPDLLLNVVCLPEHVLVRDDQAVVVEYDRERSVYRVAPLPHLRPGFGEHVEPPRRAEPVAVPEPIAAPLSTPVSTPTAAPARRLEGPQ